MLGFKCRHDQEKLSRGGALIRIKMEGPLEGPRVAVLYMTDLDDIKYLEEWVEMFTGKKDANIKR